MPVTNIRPRILIVEDDRCIQVLYRYLLKARFDVELVDNVDDAIQLAAREHFDLFLLDINLGETRTGIDLLAQLRQMPTGSATRAVACTSQVGEEYRRYLIACGFGEYVGKPFSRTQLLGAIGQTLDGARPKSYTQPVGVKAIAQGLNATW